MRARARTLPLSAAKPSHCRVAPGLSGRVSRMRVRLRSTSRIHRPSDWSPTGRAQEGDERPRGEVDDLPRAAPLPAPPPLSPRPVTSPLPLAPRTPHVQRTFGGRAAMVGDGELPPAAGEGDDRAGQREDGERKAGERVETQVARRRCARAPAPADGDGHRFLVAFEPDQPVGVGRPRP